MATMRKTPAAPLPWATAKVGGEMRISSAEGARIGALHYDGRIQHDAQRANAEYLVHAANAYPQLVAQLKHAIRVIEDLTEGTAHEEESLSSRQLLHSLGEDS